MGQLEKPVEGQLLFTRDGRRFGNAIVLRHAERHPQWGDLWTLETDYGNICRRLTTKELHQHWWFKRNGKVVIQDIECWRADKRIFKDPAIMSQEDEHRTGKGAT